MMTEKNSSKELMRVDLEFKRMLKEISMERLRRQRDKDLVSSKRLTLALTRVPRLKDLLMEADIQDELIK